MLNIIHATKENGDVYAKISSVSAMPKGVTCPPQINPSVVFSINSPDWEMFEKFPDFVKDKIKKTDEYKAQQQPELTEVAHESDEPSDLPF